MKGQEGKIMNPRVFSGVHHKVETTAAELEKGAEAFASTTQRIARRSSLKDSGDRISDPPMIDPVRFKKILLTLLKVLVVIELLNAFLEGVNQSAWGRFGFDLIIAGLLYMLWERLRVLLIERKEETRRKMETASQEIKLWDALLFSLLWSDEIYSDIPQDRRRIIVIAFTLIALGVVAAFMKIGTGLMPLVITGGLVLGAVNLLVWVVSLERGEKQSLQTELRLANEVQTALMPKSHPDIEGFDIAGLSVPAKEVGGDFFNYTFFGPGRTRLGISVFDVSGKGMQAAMSAVFTSGAFASEPRPTSSPADILTRLNRAVFTNSRRGQFVAFLLAVLDVPARTVTFANAGQTKPLLRSGDSVTWLDSVGVHFPLGMNEDSSFEERTMQLARGDVLLLLTDGFTDAMNTEKEIYGLDRLQEYLQRPGLEQRTAEELLQAIRAEVQRHAGQAPQHDDMTMVVVKVA
jgi:serine phosphatase RsbU (regulator of sigma subunit)